jgi:adenylate kinase family enzyme
MNPQLIIIRGAPGAGKSSLGRNLKKKFPSAALLELDNFRGMMNVDWTDEQQHRIALKAAALAAKTFCEQGITPVIVVDMFLPEHLNYFLGEASEINYRIISLLADEITFKKRLEERKEGFKESDKAIAIDKNIRQNSVKNETIIDTSRKTKQEISRMISAK